jgi:hypothetical protein
LDRVSRAVLHPERSCIVLQSGEDLRDNQ